MHLTYTRARLGCLLVVAVVLVAATAAASTSEADAPFAMLDIPGGSFEMGDVDGRPDEAPKPATVAAFRLMQFEVTNA